MRNVIRKIVINAAGDAFAKGLLSSDFIPEMEIESPRHENHGDFSTNFAMVSASAQKMPPRKIAEAILSFHAVSTSWLFCFFSKVSEDHWQPNLQTGYLTVLLILWLFRL
ncbi:MAG: hypothetical protein HQK67_08805, partial [Desulfamplus sp.]|nr:hypothetical protein [Desulfamplus sp.]